uniref:Uncharacterized protein n=1 Tax=Arundo donax TaxID=35708 RepID=A0A0A9FWM3_ARUDO
MRKRGHSGGVHASLMIAVARRARGVERPTCLNYNGAPKKHEAGAGVIN